MDEPSPKSAAATPKVSASSRISVFSRRLSGTSANVPVDVVGVWPTVAPAMSGSASAHAAPRVELEPVMLRGFGEKSRVVRRSSRRQARCDGAQGLIIRLKHRVDELLCLCLRERTLGVLRRDSRGPHQRDAETGHVERIAGHAPERAASAVQ